MCECCVVLIPVQDSPGVSSSKTIYIVLGAVSTHSRGQQSIAKNRILQHWTFNFTSYLPSVLLWIGTSLPDDEL